MIKAPHAATPVPGLQNVTASDDLAAIVRAAREGDVSAARELLQRVCTTIEDAKPLPQPLAMYLHAAFSAYLSGGQPLMEKALNLVSRAGGAPEINARVPVRVKRLRRIRVERHGIRTSPVATTVEGTRRQSYLVARIYLRMKLHLMSRQQALAWVGRRYRVAESDLAYYDGHLDAIRGWTVEQLKSLIRLAK
jgi:hypothetical protein